MLYFEPNFVEEALVLLERFGAGARVLAGGTRLGFDLRSQASDEVAALINVKRIAELHGCSDGGASLRIGALTTASMLAVDPAVRAHAPLLAMAADSMGARQLRTLATLGGNICSGDPISDLTTALLACDARCEVNTLQEGPASFTIAELLARRPLMLPGELLTAIEIPSAPRALGSYQKIMRRRAFEVAVVAVAAHVLIEDGRIRAARIALAGAGPTPLLAHKAAAALNGKALTEDRVVTAAALAAESDAQPPDDERASSAYRRQLIRVLIARALNDIVTQDSKAA